MEGRRGLTCVSTDDQAAPCRDRSGSRAASWGAAVMSWVKVGVYRRARGACGAVF